MDSPHPTDWFHSLNTNDRAALVAEVQEVVHHYDTNLILSSLESGSPGAAEKLFALVGELHHLQCSWVVSVHVANDPTWRGQVEGSMAEGSSNEDDMVTADELRAQASRLLAS